MRHSHHSVEVDEPVVLPPVCRVVVPSGVVELAGGALLGVVEGGTAGPGHAQHRAQE